MNGILLIDKDKNLTSHDVINKVRKSLNTKKVGHVGTLDPISTGVLVVLIGQSTKLAPFLENDTKEYVARIKFGYSTDSYDVTGNITKSMNSFLLNENTIDEALNVFLGKQVQLPPIYSAVKVKGKKLYEYARSQKEVDIPSRIIEVYKVQRISPIVDEGDTKYCDVLFMVSKGTYIRSLINELGNKINIPCCMEELRRTRSGKFLIENAVKISEVEVGNYQLVNPIDIIDFPVIKLNVESENYRKVVNGMKISPKVFSEKYERIAFAVDNKLIAVYDYVDNDIPHYKAIRVWVE